MTQWLHLATLALGASVMIQVFAVGLEAQPDDAAYLFRRPKLLILSILARNVFVPLLSIALIKVLGLHPVMAITLGVLAVTPVAPLLSKSSLQSGRESPYVLGLVVSQARLAIPIVPLLLRFFDWALGAHADFPLEQVVMLMFKTILAPMGAGMIAGRFVPALRKYGPILIRLGSILLTVGAIPLLFVAWKALGGLAVTEVFLPLTAFIVGGMLAGHLLGGPVEENRKTLAIGTAARHPALAVAIAAANFPDQTQLVSGAVVLYLILRIAIGFPYLRWRKRES